MGRHFVITIASIPTREWGAWLAQRGGLPPLGQARTFLPKYPQEHCQRVRTRFHAIAEPQSGQAGVLLSSGLSTGCGTDAPIWAREPTLANASRARCFLADKLSGLDTCATLSSIAGSKAGSTAEGSVLTFAASTQTIQSLRVCPCRAASTFQERIISASTLRMLQSGMDRSIRMALH